MKNINDFDLGKKACLDVISCVMDVLPEVLSFRDSFSRKIDGSPVSEADIFLEQEIQKRLENFFSNLCFIGEESSLPVEAIEDRWVAVLDPIDGTENFISGSRLWGVSLSIWKGKTHICSMLMMPELGETMLSGEKIKHYKSQIVGFSSSISETLVQDLSIAGEARMTGCAVFNLINVIRGTFTEFSNPVGAYSWDLLAGLQLAMDHGCEVEVDGVKYDREYLRPGKRYRVKIRQPEDSDSWQGCKC